MNECEHIKQSPYGLTVSAATAGYVQCPWCEIVRLQKSNAELYGAGKRLEGELRERAQLAESRLDSVESQLKHAFGLLWYAWHEFNAIRARDGAPVGVEHEYWDTLTERMATFLGPVRSQPWPCEEAKEIKFRDGWIDSPTVVETLGDKWADVDRREIERLRAQNKCAKGPPCVLPFGHEGDCVVVG